MALLPGLEWCDGVDASEVFMLLRDHYVEDAGGRFRLSYPEEFLRWALSPPGHRKEFHVGVRVSATKELVAFISAVPATVRVGGETTVVAVVNFLCVHRGLRGKRMTPTLIAELNRRTSARGVHRGVATAAADLWPPVSVARYHHRPLDPEKLMQTGFLPRAPGMTASRAARLHGLPKGFRSPGFREMRASDAAEVSRMLNADLADCALAPVFDEAQVLHWLHPPVSAFVACDPAAGDRPVAFVSYYTLPTKVLGNPRHEEVKAAYLWYACAPGAPGGVTGLVQDAMVAAKAAGHDVFNALDVHRNKEFLSAAGFKAGSGEVRYYLYNWGTERVTPDRVGLLLA